MGWGLIFDLAWAPNIDADWGAAHLPIQLCSFPGARALKTWLAKAIIMDNLCMFIYMFQLYL
jgi:hypothetical protein